MSFFKGKFDTFFKSGQLPRRIPKPNVIVVDPPRAGMHPDMSGYLHKLKAENHICILQPYTQARDVKILNDNDYMIKNSVMVDMFPHTPHIETVMLLSEVKLENLESGIFLLNWMSFIIHSVPCYFVLTHPYK